MVVPEVDSLPMFYQQQFYFFFMFIWLIQTGCWWCIYRSLGTLYSHGSDRTIGAESWCRCTYSYVFSTTQRHTIELSDATRSWRFWYKNEKVWLELRLDAWLIIFGAYFVFCFFGGEAKSERDLISLSFWIKKKWQQRKNVWKFIIVLQLFFFFFLYKLIFYSVVLDRVECVKKFIFSFDYFVKVVWDRKRAPSFFFFWWFLYFFNFWFI